MSRLRLLLPVLLCLAAATGCWDREEVENLGFVLALGIDSLPGHRVEVTVQVAIPLRLSPSGGGAGAGGGGGGGAPAQIVTKTAGSIPEAFRAVNRTLCRRITLAQNRLIVFGEETARKGLRPYLGLFARYREFRRTMLMVVAKGRAKEILSIRPELEKNPSEYLLDLIRQASYNGGTDRVTLNEFLRSMTQLGSTPFATYLLPPPPEKGTAGEGEGKKGKGKAVETGGVAVFRGDRMVGVYGPSEADSFLILAGRFNESFVSLSDPKNPQARAIIHLRSAIRKIDPFLRGKRMALRLMVKIEADLIATETGTDYTAPAQEKLLERKAAAAIAARLKRALKKAQTGFKVDPFGLGEKFRPLVPDWRAWEDLRWQENFPRVPITILVRLHLRRFGFQRVPPIPLT